MAIQKEVILILGKRLDVSEGDERLTIRGKQVVEAGVEVYKSLIRAGKDPHIIFSGGKSTRYKVAGAPQASEAMKMSDFAKSIGLDSSKIVLEEFSTNMRENIKNSKEELDKISEGQNIHVHIVVDHYQVNRAEIHAKMILGNSYTYEIHPAITNIPSSQVPLEKAKERVLGFLKKW